MSVQASSAVGFKVPVPDTSIASQGNLTATWARADMQQVALVFDQGKLTIVMQPAVYQDPSTDYQTVISENSAKASVSQVAGLPVLIITPNTDYYKTNPALVRFDLNGRNVDISSASYTTDELLAVAASMIKVDSTSPPSPAT